MVRIRRLRQTLTEAKLATGARRPFSTSSCGGATGPKTLAESSVSDAIAPYLPQLAQGLFLTIKVSVASFGGGLIIALVLAPLTLLGSVAVRRAIQIYCDIVRGLPELLIIFLIFYGVTTLLSAAFGRYVEVNAFTAGTAALAVVAGAYLTEILRAALVAVPAGQWEAARTLGLSPLQTLRHVIFTQMMLRALPGLGNQWLITLKESSLVSIIGLEELMRKAVVGAGASHNPVAFYCAAALVYVGLTSVSTVALSLAGGRLAVGAR